MFCLLVVLGLSPVFGENRVYELTGTRDVIAGFYVETDLPLKFQRLGGPDNQGYFFYLYNLHNYSTEWRIGDGRTESEITDDYMALGSNDGPPEGGWRTLSDDKKRDFKVIKKPSLWYGLKQTEEKGGSGCLDGGVVCLDRGSNRWIMLEGSDPRMCDHKTDCKGAFDEICPREKPATCQGTLLPVVLSTVVTLILTLCVILAILLFVR